MCGVATEVRGRCNKDNNVVRIVLDVNPQTQNWQPQVKMSILGSKFYIHTMVSHNTQKVSDRMEYILYLYVRDTPQCSEGEPYEQPQTQSAGNDGASCEV